MANEWCSCNPLVIKAPVVCVCVCGVFWEQTGVVDDQCLNGGSSR